MKILQICNKVPFPPKDGGALAVWNLSKGLSQQNEELYVLALNTTKHPVPKVALPIEFQEKISIESVDIDTDIKYADLFKNFLFDSEPYNLLRFKSQEFSNKLISVLEIFQPEIVLLEGLSMAWYINDIRQHSNARVVMRAHNVEHVIWQGLLIEEKSALTRIYLKNLTKRIRKFEVSQLKNYDALIPISLVDEKWHRHSGYNGPTLTIPFGVEITDPNESTLKVQQNDLIYIGALDWAPNVEGIIWFIREVWPRLHSEFPELNLHIAGRNPTEEVKRLIQADGIIFYGEIDHVSELFEKGNIMIIPLFSGSGMRVKIIEGFQAGKLIITTIQGLEGIPAKPGNHLLLADTADEFTNQIKMSLQKPEVIAQIGSKGKEFVKHNFNNFALSKELISFFNSLTE